MCNYIYWILRILRYFSFNWLNFNLFIDYNLYISVFRERRKKKIWKVKNNSLFFSSYPFRVDCFYWIYCFLYLQFRNTIDNINFTYRNQFSFSVLYSYINFRWQPLTIYFAFYYLPITAIMKNKSDEIVLPLR